MTAEELREKCFQAKEFSTEILEWIQKENLWNIWVPKAFGGLEFSLTKGLEKLKELAKIDGSLGWTITLCSGANFFIGNLQKEVANEIFSQKNVCFGGSGGAFGTAEKIGNKYRINGTWRYATGSKYLSHFTLNANILQNGKPVINQDGTPYIRSFVLPKNKVEIIEDWNAMGLRATVTHSFHVDQVECHEKYSFLYTKTYLPQALYQINFGTFADLTLWVNYLGMVTHFVENLTFHFPQLNTKSLQQVVNTTNQQLFEAAYQVENQLNNNLPITQSSIDNIHQKAVKSVREITREIIQIYPYTGIRGSSIDHAVNQLFRDYFTGTQHPIFTKKQ